MQTNQLTRVHKNKKRMTVARGGKRGKTAGRGGKGQSARAGNKRRPEWRDIIKKLPKLRGRGVNQNKSFANRPAIVNLVVLEEIFNSGDAITPTILVEKGVIDLKFGKIPAVKILGTGEITKAFKISGCDISGSAKEKVEKAKGEVVTKAGKTIIKVKKEVKKVESKVENAQGASVKVEKVVEKKEGAEKAKSAKKSEKKVEKVVAK